MSSSAIINILFPFLLLPLFLFLLPFALFFTKTRKKSVLRRSKLPPSPPKLPIIGHLHQLGKLPHQSLFKLSQEYGPAMLLHLGTTPTLVISSPNFAKEILKEHDLNFCSRPKSPGPKRIFYNYVDVAFAPYGDLWRSTRKIFACHLLGSKRAESFSRAREIEIGKLIDYLSRASPNPVNLDERVFDLVGGVVGMVAFGNIYRREKFEGKVLKDVMDEAMHMIDSFSAEDFFPHFGWIIDFLTGHKARLEKCFCKLDSYLEMMLNEHYKVDSTREGDEHEDLTNALIRLSSEENGLNLSKEQIKAILMNTFLGGVNTSAIVIVWAMCELMRHPRVMKKVQEEIRCKINGVNPKVESNDLGKFTYLKMIVKETLRLHPPVPLSLPRESSNMCHIRGEKWESYDVYPNTRVLINVWAIGRDPGSWKNPNEFYPERFEENGVDFRGQHFEFLPFGGGRRICPGISNSIATIELALANLLYWFDWEVPNGMEVDLEEEGRLTLYKRTHLTLVPVKYACK